ncbi:hypothetical protein HY489_03085 [Candidatus Woesearchaeota archaeon]|nr:hypothetical protein [Candidatus Woesearchaeota archaeon]
MKKVPQSLRTWFVVHFWADLLFALPLLFAPEWTLVRFGFTTVEPVTARLVGAALVGIGGASLVHRNASKDAYSAMLTVKTLWSGTASLSLLWAATHNAPKSTWLFLAIFVFFFCVWMYYKHRLR